jgi:hypothetical protein
VGIGGTVGLQGDGVDAKRCALHGKPQAAGLGLKIAEKLIAAGLQNFPLPPGPHPHLFGLHHPGKLPLQKLKEAVHVLLELPTFSGRKKEVAGHMGGEEVMDVTNIRRDGLALGNLLQELGDCGGFAQARLAGNVNVVPTFGGLEAQAQPQGLQGPFLPNDSGKGLDLLRRGKGKNARVAAPPQRFRGKLLHHGEVSYRR